MNLQLNATDALWANDSLNFLLTTSQKHILKYDDSAKGWMWKGRAPRTCDFHKGQVPRTFNYKVLKVAYLIEKGISDFKFKQFEHARVKVEQARGVGRKLCMRKYFRQFVSESFPAFFPSNRDDF